MHVTPAGLVFGFGVGVVYATWRLVRDHRRERARQIALVLKSTVDEAKREAEIKGRVRSTTRPTGVNTSGGAGYTLGPNGTSRVQSYPVYARNTAAAVASVQYDTTTREEPPPPAWSEASGNPLAQEYVPGYAPCPSDSGATCDAPSADCPPCDSGTSDAGSCGGGD